MPNRFESLLRDYETGGISRRQLLAALVVASAAPSRGQTTEPAFRGTVVNHVTLSVSDVGRSRAFYESLLGGRALGETGTAVDLGIGSSFIGLYPMRDPGRIDHFSVGVEDFDAEQALTILQRRFADTSPFLRTNSLGQKEIYLEDPDGVRVQLSAIRYKL